MTYKAKILLVLVGGGLICAVVARRLNDNPESTLSDGPTNTTATTDNEARVRPAGEPDTDSIPQVPGRANSIPRFTIGWAATPESMEGGENFTPVMPDPRDAPMYEALKLSRPQVTRVDAALRSLKEGLKVLAVEISTGKLTREEWHQAADRLDEETNAELLAVLGPDKLKEFDEYESDDVGPLIDHAAAVLRQPDR